MMIFNTGAYLKISREVTKGNQLPQIIQFQVKAGQTVAMSSKVAKTEESALASLKEKVNIKLHIFSMSSSCTKFIQIMLGDSLDFHIKERANHRVSEV